MPTLLQISDPHFGTEVAGPVDALRCLHAEQQPDLVVVSGDITQRATRRQFGAAARFFTSLSPRALLLLPGNHDIPLVNLALRLFDPFRRYRAAFGDDLEPVHDSEQLLVIGINTVRPRWHTDGAVSPAQIDRVSQRLARAGPRQLRVVVTHQPAAVIRPQDAPHRLVRADEALTHWIDAGMDLILGGHIHLPYVIALQDRYPDRQRPAWLAQAGTACSNRTRSGIPNSVNLVRIEAPAVASAAEPAIDPAAIPSTATAPGPRPKATIERWDYDTHSGRFRLGQRHPITPAPTRAAARPPSAAPRSAPTRASSGSGAHASLADH